MKAVIKTVTFNKDVETKVGIMYQYKITYNDITASYLSKKKEQTDFVAGQECEFVEEKKEGSNGTIYFNVKPIPKNLQNNYAKAVKKEQSRYSGFATSYAKDLVIAGKITFEQMLPAAEKLFHFMVALDKTLES